MIAISIGPTIVIDSSTDNNDYVRSQNYTSSHIICWDNMPAAESVRTDFAKNQDNKIFLTLMLPIASLPATLNYEVILQV